MSHYLHVCAGPYQILLDADGIHEILELDGGDGAQAAGHRDWRGQVLASVNGRALLGMKQTALPRERAGVVYSAGVSGVPLMLEFDRVARLRHVGEASLLPLPPVPEKAFRLFDGVLSDKEAGTQLYHLRRPLDATVFMDPAEEAGQTPAPQDGSVAESAAVSAPPARKRRGRGKRKG